MKKIIVLFAIFILSITSVIACSCIAPGSPPEEREKAAAVFQGRVIELDDNRFSSTNPTTKVKFQVTKVWKGGIGTEHIIETSTSSAACGYNFELGEEYIVYTSWEDPTQVTLCSRTARVSESTEDINLLGEGTVIQTPVEESPSIEKTYRREVIIIAIIGLVLVAIVLFVRRKK